MATNIWVTDSNPTAGSDLHGQAMRIECKTTGASQGQVRVTLYNTSNDTAITYDNASIGVSSTSPTLGGGAAFSGSIGSSTWVRLTFVTAGGGNNITVPIGANVVSDWVNLTSSSGDVLLVDLDINSGSIKMQFSVATTNSESWFSNAGGSFYNVAAPSVTDNGAKTFAISLIETQAGAAAVTLMGAICL